MSNPSRATPELAISAAWHEQRFGGPLRTIDGEPVEVIHRGAWSHGLGPDFSDALILFNGRELRPGAVEVHLKTSAWAAHGHHLDPAYDAVVLHVVLRHDGGETRRHDGALVPVLEIEPFLTEPLPIVPATVDWSRFGGTVCAPELATRQPGRIRHILWQLGDTRLAAKSARLEARLTSDPPAEVLFQEIWDGLGFSANREPMGRLARLVPLASLEALLATDSAANHVDLARGILFGAAGFLPLSPHDAALGKLSPAAAERLEAAWRSHGGAWHRDTLAATAWTRARVRPANHPVARLAAGAAMIGRSQTLGGLLTALLAPLRAGADPLPALRELAGGEDSPGLGPDRAGSLLTNALLPFALALAEQSGDGDLTEAAARAWEHLPAGEANAITRRAHRQVAGNARMGPIGSRGQQGLIHLDATLCAPRRCYECPIARAVVEAEPAPPG